MAGKKRVRYRSDISLPVLSLSKGSNGANRGFEEVEELNGDLTPLSSHKTSSGVNRRRYV